MDDTFVRLEYARKHLGLSYKVLSEIFGLTSDGVNKAIKNKRLNAIQINTFADTYNVSKDWLIDGLGDFRFENNSKDTLFTEENSEISELKEILALKEQQITILKKNLSLLQEQIKIDTTSDNTEKIKFLEKENDYLRDIILEKLNNLPLLEIKEIHQLMTRNLLIEKLEKERTKLNTQKTEETNNTKTK